MIFSPLYNLDKCFDVLDVVTDIIVKLRFNPYQNI